MQLRYVTVIGIICVLTGAAITRVYWTKTVEKEVIKERTKTTERIVISPDGTRTEERVIDEKREDKRITESGPRKPDWYVYGGTGGGSMYAIGVNRRILGPISIGAQYATNGTGLVTVGFEF